MISEWEKWRSRNEYKIESERKKLEKKKKKESRINNFGTHMWLDFENDSGGCMKKKFLKNFQIWQKLQTHRFKKLSEPQAK